MQKMHYLKIDGELLLTFVTIFSEQSISKAASRLGQNASTLSHRLERLRNICEDPLFVRAGKSIVPTTKATAMFSEAQNALKTIQGLVVSKTFIPSMLNETFVIASTDLEPSVLLIDLHKKALKEAPELRIDFVWDHFANTTKALRRNDYAFILTPNSILDTADIKARMLMRDPVVCYYDPAEREAPDTMELYLTAKHIRVMFSMFDTNYTDNALKLLGKPRHASVTLPSYSEAAHFLRGTKLITTLPAQLANSVMKDFAACSPPFYMEDYAYSLYWHESTHESPKHKWFREQIFKAVQQYKKPKAH